MIVIKMRMIITHACPGQLDNEIQVCTVVTRCPVVYWTKPSYFFITAKWLGIWLSSIKDTFCDIYIHRKTF